LNFLFLYWVLQYTGVFQEQHLLRTGNIEGDSFLKIKVQTKMFKIDSQQAEAEQ